MTNPVYGPRSLINLPMNTYVVANLPPIVVDTSEIHSIAVDVVVQAITGGSGNATIEFVMERQGAEGTWFQFGTSGAISVFPQTYSVDITDSLGHSLGTGSNVNVATESAVFTRSMRVRWILAGTTLATGVTFSASVIGRP